MVIGADATASPGFSSKAAAAASPTATPSPGGDPPSPAKMSTNATLAAPPAAQNGELTPAEVILDTENIEPVPGPLDDPDFPKQKPGETLVNRLKVQGMNIALLIFCVLLSWCIGALGMSFVWTILLVIALHKTDWKIKKEGWITYVSNVRCLFWAQVESGITALRSASACSKKCRHLTLRRWFGCAFS